MGSEEFEADEAREGEDARHCRLRRALRRDEDEHPRQQDAPPTFDHLIVVELGTLACERENAVGLKGDICFYDITRLNYMDHRQDNCRRQTTFLN